jgi:uncharacterized membrane protein
LTSIAAGLLSVGLLASISCTLAEEHRGLFVFGHEAHTVRLCGDTRTLWVHSTGPIREQLQADYERLATHPYDEVYLEFEGKIVTEPSTGFAADYDGVIAVEKIRAMRSAGEADCVPGKSTEAGARAADPTAKTYVFVCPGMTEYVVRSYAHEAWVFRPIGTLQLPATGAAEGSAYSDGSFELRIDEDGDQAQMGTPGELQVCQNDRRRAIWERAKLDGADFRAIGNEPGWNLEIQAQTRIVLVTDYGETRVELPLPTPVEDSANRTAIWDAGDLQLQVIGHPCRDTMSGETFESEAIVTWRGQTLRGCGRALH